MLTETVDSVTFRTKSDGKTVRVNIQENLLTVDIPENYRCLSMFKVDRALMAAVLEEDALYRRAISWPKVSYETVAYLHRFYCPDYSSPDDELCRIVSNKYFTIEQDEKVAIANLKTCFPRVDMILQFGKGNIVVAGGVFTTTNKRGFNLRNTPKDCDFFFWGLKSTSEADSILRSICFAWLAMPGTKVYRSDHVTTLVEEVESKSRAYQIIHRIYPNKMSIIGGFDLAPSMCLYDGDSILFTPLSAFTYAFRVFFVDISRQSKSFSTRITKYCSRGFMPFIACKPFKDILSIVRDLGILPVSGSFFVKIAPTYGICMNTVFIRAVSSQFMKREQIQGDDYDVGIDVRSKISLKCANSKLLASGQLGNVTKLIELPNLEPVEVSKSFKYLAQFASKVEGYKFLGRGIVTRIQCYYGESANFITEKSDTKEVARFMRDNLESLKTKIEQSMALVLSKSEVSWMGIDQNPSRQLFTSSFKPVMQNGAWVYPAYAKPLYIGVPFEVYKTLWIGNRQKDCMFSCFSRDLFRYFMFMLRYLLVPESPIKTMLNLINVVQSELKTTE